MYIIILIPTMANIMTIYYVPGNIVSVCVEKQRSQTVHVPASLQDILSQRVSQDSFASLEIEGRFSFLRILIIYFQIFYSKLYYFWNQKKKKKSLKKTLLHLSNQQGYFSLIVVLILIKNTYMMLWEKSN